MRQATTRTVRGSLIRRWYLTLPDGRRVVTWATTKTGAQVKCLTHRGVRATSIAPAPAGFDDISALRSVAPFADIPESPARDRALARWRKG